MSKPLKAFITYSHEDEQKRKKLRTCLAVMERKREIKPRDDTDTTAGGKARQEDILKEVANSDMLLYLVSAASLASKNCNKELTEAVRTGKRVIPIILESCDWPNHQLSGFEVLPHKGKPINKWQPESDGWQNVVDGIREAVEEMQTQSDSSSETSERELRAKLAFQHGNVLMMIGEVNMAIEHYSRAIEFNPNHASTYNNRGAAYERKGDIDRAIDDYTKAIHLNLNDAIAYSNRGGAYLDKGDIDHAIEDCNIAIDLNPNHASTYNNRGVAYERKGDIDHAIDDYTKAIRLNPNDAMAYSNRGGAYRDKGDIDHAIEDCNIAIGLNPHYADAYNNRGAAYNKQGDYDHAIEDYTYAIQFKPDYAEAYNNRGLAYSHKDDGRAVGDFNTAIDLKPDYPEAYNNRGMAYGKQGDIDRAIRDLNKAIQLDPDYAEAYSNRGLAYNGKGDYNRAIRDLNTAIELKPDYAEAYSNRGAVFVSRGDYDRAIRDFNTAIALNPDSAIAYFNRGVVYCVKGDIDSAIADVTKAIQLKPDLAEAYYYRGTVWLHLREWDEAQADLSVARDKGIDIIASFHNEYKNVEAYERANRVKLPEDIALMLTQRRRSRFPKTEKLLSPDGTPLESPDVLNLLAKLRNAGPPLSQYLQTRPAFGIKTGASGAFVVDGATRDQLIAEHPASADILKPFLHRRHIRRWGVESPVDKSRSIGDAWLIFSYRGIEIDRYPAIRKHLEQYRSVLSKRSGKQKWYELPVTKRDAERFTQTKLICPNSYDHQTFAVDTEGFYCGDTCYLIPTEETWLCGLLNSRAVEWFYSQTSNQLTIDYLRARSRHIQAIPIPDLTPTQKSLIGKIVDYLIFLQEQPTTRGGDLAHSRDFIILRYFERIIDGLAYESYLSEELHQGEKQFFKPLLEERLPQLEEIRGDKMVALQEIFERLYERTHPIRRNLFFLNSVKPIRIIEDRT